jgi:hypothetical protein
MNDGFDVHIEIRGELSQRWADRFAGMAISTIGEGTTVPITKLSGQVTDQSALLGILLQLHNLGLDILLVRQEQMPPTGHGADR